MAKQSKILYEIFKLRFIIVAFIHVVYAAQIFNLTPFYHIIIKPIPLGSTNLSKINYFYSNDGLDNKSQVKFYCLWG